MPVKPLLDLAMATIFKNIKELNNAGDFLPYETLRPILLKVESAKQLRQLEINSPQIQGETAEVWLKIIEKDFPMEYRAKPYKPPDPTKWYKVYETYKKIHDRSLEESEAKLKQALQGLREDREKNTSRIVNPKLLPREPRSGPRRNGPRDHTSSTMSFGSGSRTKTLTSAGVMRKVRRETKEIANIHGSLARISRAPSRLNAAAQIKRAPAGMVAEYQRAANPAFRAAASRPASEPTSAVKQYESRATYISDDGSDDGDGGLDDIFDEEISRVKGGFKVPKPESGHSKAAKTHTPNSASNVHQRNVTSKPIATPRKGRGLLSGSYKARPPVITTKSSGSIPKESFRDVKPKQEAPPAKPDFEKSPPNAATIATTSIVRESPDEGSQAVEQSEPKKINTFIRKRKPVDIFMRANKRSR